MFPVFIFFRFYTYGDLLFILWRFLIEVLQYIVLLTVSQYIES